MIIVRSQDGLLIARKSRINLRKLNGTWTIYGDGGDELAEYTSEALAKDVMQDVQQHILGCNSTIFEFPEEDLVSEDVRRDKILEMMAEFKAAGSPEDPVYDDGRHYVPIPD